MLRRMVSTICLMVLFQSVIIAADAQDPRAQRIKQRLDESGQYFRQGDLLMGANRVSEAASLLKASPGAMPNTTPVKLAADCVRDLNNRANQAKASGNSAQSTKCMLAQQNILDSLISWEPQNPEWHFRKGMVFMALAGDSRITAGDRANLSFAMREFQQTMSCPGSDAYQSPATQMLSMCQKELAQRQEKGRQIRAAGARQLRQLQSIPDSNQGEIHCNNCGHVRPATSDRCGTCGSF